MSGTRAGVMKAWAKRLGVTQQELQANYRRGLSWCYLCRQWLTLIRFASDRSRPTGRKSVCRSCDRIKFTTWTYGLTMEDAMAVHSGKLSCAICGRVQKLVVDHNHKSGKVRGYLCRHCNLGLGHFGDDAKFVRKALTYLEENNG